MCISLSQLTTSWLAFSTSGANTSIRLSPPRHHHIPHITYIEINYQSHFLDVSQLFWDSSLEIDLRAMSERSCILITCALSINLLRAATNLEHWHKMLKLFYLQFFMNLQWSLCNPLNLQLRRTRLTSHITSFGLRDENETEWTKKKTISVEYILPQEGKRIINV